VRSPPPPPNLLTKSELARLAILDPAGFALAEEKLDEFFPSLEYVLSRSSGGQFDEGLGTIYSVSKHMASVAFLSTEAFEEKDSLSARMIQARFTGVGRFSCLAMLRFASANAAAGTNAPEAARGNNPEGFTAPYDRNWLLYWSILFSESLEKQTGVTGLEVNVLEFWRQQCEEPASYRVPLPESEWREDPLRMGEEDAFGNVAAVRDFAPLVSFGSLRQLRDAYGAAASSTGGALYTEDATVVLMRDEVAKAIEEHAENDADAMDRTGVASGGSYGRRLDAAHAPPAPLGSYGVHYADNETTVATIDARRSVGHSRRGRKLFISGIIGSLISKALGAGFKELDKELNFEVPDMPRPHFFYDTLARRENPLLSIVRDVFCNPTTDLSIEEAVGDPPPHAPGDDLWDAATINQPYSLQAPAALRGGDVKRAYGASQPTSGVARTYVDTSTQVWVYVTSSDDPNVSPGFHRLADLRVWPDVQCDAIASQPCGSLVSSSAGASSDWARLSWFAGLGRRMAGVDAGAVTTVYVNEQPEYATPISTKYVTGIEALLNSRCSTYLASNGVAGARPCTGTTFQWFRAHRASGCYAGRLQLLPTSTYKAVSSYLGRFTPPSPPPAPPP
jgi:hypothetical protein